MRKKLSGVIAILLICCIGTSIAVSGQENGKQISFETYSDVMIEAYAEYGVEIEPIYPGADVVLTEDILNNDLSKVEENVKKFKAKSIVPNISIPAENLEKDNATRGMYGYATGYASYTISDFSLPVVPRWAVVKIAGKVYGDVNNCTIFEAYKPTLTLTSATGYDDYIVCKSYSYRLDNSQSPVSKHHVNYNITCELKEVDSIGTVSSWVKVEKNFSVKVYPFA